MDLVEASTERTTAATDALIALAAIAAIVAIRRRTDPSFARAVWLSALGATAAASALGAVAHGTALRNGVRDLLWQPLYVALGATMALFVVGAVNDWRGARAGRCALLPMLGVALGFYGVTRAAGGSFLVFVIYEAAALVFALAVYLALARTGRRAGAATMAAALAVSIGAGVVQASGVGPVRLVWTFDHNGLFHLVQLAGLTLLALGLRRLLASPVPETSG